MHRKFGWGETWWKEPLLRLMYNLEIDIKTDHEEREWEYVDRIYLAQNPNKSRAPVNPV
jgi:hypothetical protein